LSMPLTMLYSHNPEDPPNFCCNSSKGYCLHIQAISQYWFTSYIYFFLP
jgi:hypothetical protein